jgi:hypothetical protein
MIVGVRIAKILLAVVALLAIAARADAAGFDYSYNVFRGDLNGDGRTDLYVKTNRSLVIPFDDLPIVVGPPVREFVLQYRGDGSFDLIANLTTAQRIAAS